MSRIRTVRTVLAGLLAGASAFSASLTLPGGTSGQETAAAGYYCHDTFESGTDDWEGRGGASVSSGGTAYAGSSALRVTDRGSSWHGAQKKLDSAVFTSGGEYSFSAAVSGTGKMMLSLEYKDTSGNTKYGHIAEGDSTEDYIQLANSSFRLPEGSDYVLYVETESGTSAFSIDEVIIAEAGTQIDGLSPVKIIPGDIDFDEEVTAFDVVLARKGVIGGLTGNALRAGDVNGDDEMTVADLVQISGFVLGQVQEFKQVEKPTSPPVSAEGYMDSIRDRITANVPAEVLKDQGGNVVHITYYSTKAGRDKGANVWLPPGYDENKKYPVFYVNHGYGGDERTMMNGMGVLEIATNLINSGEAVPMIIVFTDQYTDPNHPKQTGNGQADVPGYDNFVEDLPDSLMPYIESHFPVKTGRENTAVAGFSMGGRESLYIGIKCCDKVGYIGGGAPAPGIFPTKDQFMDHPGVMSKDDMRIDPPYSPYLLLIAGGTNDGMVNDFPKQYSDLFTQHGTDNIYLSVPGGGHDSSTVIPMMYNFIRFIFKAG
ncbi:alpha/beta hydrolase-fold protein [uncultured Ruminococcus sp.]|uniref:alpha/beta hydrolase-fold protein n=1 Tax=uncultured Ruminococcus sp. TaxID=165186 RepID=UPI00260699ED|nr:alpha/beta hydrolase-fold protein [uncultured Ruminococcus sp.]